jgi:autotransporter-associated beta strand protein
VIAGTNNTHSGGTLVATFGPTETHTTIARTEGSLGTGPVTVETNTIMALDKTVSADWTLTNTLAGAGTFKVEDGSATYRLTAGGTVSPGTNTGHTAILRVDGKFAFAQNGGTPSTLAIDVASAGTTPGVNHDQFTVDHPDTTLASSITNCALVVTRVPTPNQMNELTLTILSAPLADFTPSSCRFASVTGLGAGGTVNYGNGSITVTWTAQTPIINNGAYSNLAATSCDVSGYLSSTGASPTVVRCYWGTNLVDWGYTNDLGTQAIGTVWTSLTNLTSTVKYYYRFYATNDAGEYWSVATSNFTTLGDVYWNDTASGNWNADNANTWGPGTGVYPKEWLNDHVTIDSHTVTLKNSLTAGSTAPADITLATNGTLQAGTASTTYSIDSPVTFNGGTVYGGGSGYGLTFNGPVTMQGISTANVSYLDTVTFNGPVSGAGKLVAISRQWQSGVSFANTANTNWTGTLDISGTDNGTVSVTTNRGLGRATVNVYRQLSLRASQNYGSDPQPTINVYPGGGIYFGSGSQTIASDIPVFMRGGAWSTTTAAGQTYNNCTQSGPVTLVSNTVVGCSDYAVVWNFTGPIDGPGQFILQSPGTDHGAGTTTLGGNNSYAGGTWVQSGLLVAKNTNAFGSGAVQVDYNTNATSHGVIRLAATTPSSNYWTLANNLVGGCGTNVALQVENGASTNALTLLGTLDPGTNGTAVTTNSTGIFRVAGSVAFGVGSRLRIHIADTNGVAGVDFDRLLVDHDLTGLGNATLEVAVSSSLTPEMLNGLSFVVVSNATALVGTFGSVEWSGPWQGKVVYNQPTGTVKLTESDLGSVYKFR